LAARSNNIGVARPRAKGDETNKGSGGAFSNSRPSIFRYEVGGRSAIIQGARIARTGRQVAWRRSLPAFTRIGLARRIDESFLAPQGAPRAGDDRQLDDIGRKQAGTPLEGTHCPTPRFSKNSRARRPSGQIRITKRTSLDHGLRPPAPQVTDYEGPPHRPPPRPPQTPPTAQRSIGPPPPPRRWQILAAQTAAPPESP